MHTNDHEFGNSFTKGNEENKVSVLRTSSLPSLPSVPKALWFLSRKVWLIVKAVVILGNCSTGEQRRYNYASLNLVHYRWVYRGDYREIGDARAHDDFLDNRARYHRIDHRRRRYPHVFAPDNRTISSCRSHFFHTWRDPGSLRLHQAEYPFSPRSLISKEENCSRGR